MNKILNRQLFRGKSYKPRAHGSGITTLVVDDKPVQFLYGGSGPSGVVDPGVLPPDEVAPVVTARTEPPPEAAPAVPPPSAERQPGIAALGQQYAEMFQKMYPTRSTEQILAERQRLLGDGKNDFQLQAALALMGLGGRIASTPGSIMTAVGKSLPDFSAEMMKAAAERTRDERALKLSALEAADRERQMKSQLGLQGLQTAITQSFTSSEAEKGRKFQAGENALSREATAKEHELTRTFQGQQGELNREAQRLLQDRSQAFQKGERTDTQDFSLLIRDPVTFVTVDPSSPNGMKFGSYKLNKEGKYVDENGNEKPASALKFDAQVAKILTPEFGEPKAAYVPDLTDPTGLRSVTVQTDKRTDKLVQLNADGTRSPLPEGFVLRGQNEVIDRKDLGGGFFQIIPKEGPYKDAVFVLNAQGQIQNGDELRARGIDASKIRNSGVAPDNNNAAPAAPQQRGAAPVQQNIQVTEVIPEEQRTVRDEAINAAAKARGSRPIAIGEITGQGAQRYLVEAQPSSSVRPFDIPDKERQAIRTGTIQGERTLRQIENATKGAYEAVGLGPKLKSIATEVFDPLIPGADLAFSQNETKKLELRMLQKSVISTLAQNTDRVSVYEQKLLEDLTANPDAWLKNPKVALEQLRELHRNIANRTEADRATLEGRPALVIKRVPTGTDKDPFTPDYIPYIEYMNKTGRGDYFTGKKFFDGSQYGTMNPSR